MKNAKPVSIWSRAINILGAFGTASLASKVWSISNYRDFHGIGLDLALASAVLWVTCLLMILDEVKAIMIAGARRISR